MGTILIFHKTGLQTTIQDLGRTGFQAFGLPLGGALDRESAKLANILVANDANNPLLEITYLGPKIEFKGKCQIALTGADISPKLNGNLLPQYKTIDISEGDIISFGKLQSGCRSYLAVGGKWDVDYFLGSAATLPIKKQGITPRNIIKKGSKIKINTSYFSPINIKPNKPIIVNNELLQVKIIPGPEFNLFSNKEIASFFSQDFTITQQSNRMGLRLKEKLVFYEPKKELISSGIVPGTIQIVSGGNPIVLLADAQTVGGYPRIGNVISRSLDDLGQLKPGDKIRFKI